MEYVFLKYRNNIIGQNQLIKTPYHQSIKLVYADWIASGRMYLPIEERMLHKFLPFVANTHTDTNYTGSTMTYAYHKAQQIIKKHVGATDQDVLVSSNSGMTGVINKFQRILGLRIHESFKEKISLPEEQKPVVFITHMEHHSNQISWMETIADVVIVPPDDAGLVSVVNFEKAINKYQHRKTKIAAVTACSNVTGIITPYLEIAQLMHQYKGLCFVDFASVAPYLTIDMHPNDAEGVCLDAIYLSPHKFLGGPGTAGVLVFNQQLYKNAVPDNPGGGTVSWTNPWGQHKYLSSIEAREDGGTPPFLQTIKTAMCMQLKEEMGVENIRKREDEILEIVWDRLGKLPNLCILGKEHKKRLGIVSFYIKDLHYNLGVKLLNDKFGIQTRGGCSCAGTYGHHLLGVSKQVSYEITNQIDRGDNSNKPGWIRLSFHPTQSNQEIEYITNGVKQLSENFTEWSKDYDVDYVLGRIKPKNISAALAMEHHVDKCFTDNFL